MIRKETSHLVRLDFLLRCKEGFSISCHLPYDQAVAREVEELLEELNRTGDDFLSNGVRTFSDIEKVAIVDALTHMNGARSCTMWDAQRKEASERVLAKLRRT